MSNEKNPTWTLRERPGRQLGGHTSLNWAISYGDLITQLLVFFVILLAASQFNHTKVEVLQRSFDSSQVATTASVKQDPLAHLSEILRATLIRHGLQDSISVTQDWDGVTLVIRDSLLFPSGDALLTPDTPVRFRPILEAFLDLPATYRFIIEGHTDDLPISNERFRSNWELSSARALSVLYLFRDFGVKEKRMSISSFGDQQPLLPNQYEHGTPLSENQRQNRRVVIRVN